MNVPEVQTIEMLLSWLRLYFAVCAGVYMLIAVVGGWYASLHPSRWLWILPAMMVAYAVSLPFHWAFTNDDAFIFYRFAENIAAGLGISYNPGTPCEGFTSPAWTFIIALCVKVGFSAIVASKIIGAVLGAVAIVFMVLSVHRFCDDSRVTFLCAFFVTTAQILMAWIPSGMDTALFVAWLALWVYTLANDEIRWSTLVILIAFGVWIRPEAYLISLVGVGTIILRGWKTLPAARLTAIGIATLAVVALPFVWRFNTFGDLLPTTFYAKSDRTIRSGLGFLFGAAHGYGAIAVTVSVTGAWMLRRSHTWLAASIAAIGVYVVWIGGDVLVQRFSLWWFPYFLIGMAASLQVLINTPHLVPRALIPLVALLIAGQELHRMYSITRARSEADGYSYVSANAIHTEEADAAIGRYLKSSAQPTDTLVTDNIGAIGYYSGLHVIDVLGLVDRRIAALIHENKKDQIADAISQEQPHWMICNELPGTGEPRLPNLEAATQDLTKTYTEVGRWRSRTGYSRILLRRNEVPAGSNAAPQN